VLDLLNGHLLAFHFCVATDAADNPDHEVDVSPSTSKGPPASPASDDSPGLALYDALAAGFTRTGTHACALHVPSTLLCLPAPGPGIQRACAALGIALQRVTPDEVHAFYGTHAQATLERTLLGVPMRWDRELDRRTLSAEGLAEVIDGYAERELGCAPLRARRRRQRERAPDYLLAGCDPAERYPVPVLQALLPHRTSHVTSDGTVAVAGVRYADEREHLLACCAGIEVQVVRSQQVPGRAWVHLVDEVDDLETPTPTSRQTRETLTQPNSRAADLPVVSRAAAHDAVGVGPGAKTAWVRAGAGPVCTPVCTVATAELRQRLGRHWPSTEGSGTDAGTITSVAAAG
jgi:hypothetical protein